MPPKGTLKHQQKKGQNNFSTESATDNILVGAKTVPLQDEGMMELYDLSSNFISLEDYWNDAQAVKLMLHVGEGMSTKYAQNQMEHANPNAWALACVPNGSGAACLNVTGLECMEGTFTMQLLDDISNNHKYMVVMNEGIVPLENVVKCHCTMYLR
ncbi:hypothetical protein K7X08_002389 [Anisodus acutangulus]|uniref:Uncharacterized protein n=1 Tax=Anisodus acutangulus TaxID=402998 RepID=A0A9Q1LP43_9SOLA|nr:hypothetical protein K7X08_002389 [Anisodus acutangulus]